MGGPVPDCLKAQIWPHGARTPRRCGPTQVNAEPQRLGGGWGVVGEAGEAGEVSKSMWGNVTCEQNSSLRHESQILGQIWWLKLLCDVECFLDILTSLLHAEFGK